MIMNKKTHKILLLIFFLIFSGFIWWSTSTYINMLKRCDTIGMVSAVDGAFIGELTGGNPTIFQIIGDIRNGLTLDEQQYDMVINELLSKGYNLDHSKLDTTNPFFFDPWSNRLVIRCKKLPDGRYMSQTISKGKDGILGNADDIRAGDKFED